MEHRLHCPCPACWSKAERLHSGAGRVYNVRQGYFLDSPKPAVRAVEPVAAVAEPKKARIYVKRLTHAERRELRLKKIEQVRILRAEGKTYREVADIFGTTKQAIHSMLSRD